MAIKRKSDFAWDGTRKLGYINVNEKKRMEVTFNMLNREGEEVWYVSIATQEFFQAVKKGETEPSWHYTKNATFPLDIWHGLSSLINSNIETGE